MKPFVRSVTMILAGGLVLAVLAGGSRSGPQDAGKSPTPTNGPAVKDRLAKIDGKLNPDVPNLVAMYKDLHANPELSLQEVKSAARMAAELRTLGFEVTEKVGGTGVVGVLKNGAGPTVLVRADMDALPVVEQTGVPYASKVRTRDRFGNDVGVMHACGHDLHMTCWVGAARVLAGLKDQWAGTLVFIAQPAEEIGVGARAMIEDGLFKRFPKPDYCLALHCDARLPVNQIAYTEGLALANVDTIDITVKGKGGHGAAPHTTVDPIVLAARIVLDLQTIVSRELNPTDPAVVTVGSIHGGTKHNIIPNEVKLQLTVRTTKDTVRDHVLKAIERICKTAAAGARAEEPEVKVNLEEFTPATLNDVKLTRRTVAVFKEMLGEDNVKERPPIMGGEDFGRYGREGVPIFMYFLGTIAPDRWAESEKEGGRPLPSMHADGYAPAPEPSVQTGVRTMCLAVLDLVGKK
jgi:hippurate hydrolase